MNATQSKLEFLDGGKCRYTLQNGNFYEGPMIDGAFHGHGTFYIPGKGRIVGRWEHGSLVERRFEFEDEMAFAEDDWKYLDSSSHRFASEIRDGVEFDLEHPRLTDISADLPEDHPLYQKYTDVNELIDSIQHR